MKKYLPLAIALFWILPGGAQQLQNAEHQSDPELIGLYDASYNAIKEPGEHERNPRQNKEPKHRSSSEGLIYQGIVGAVDVVVDDLGHIYAAHIRHVITPSLRSYIMIHRSTDEGETWSEFFLINISPSSLLTKMQLISIHGNGDNYLLAYYITTFNELRVLRWNTTSGGPFSSQSIATAVSEFAMDNSFPANTSDALVFGVYKKTNGEVRSSRSTAGFYGLNWGDESADLGNLHSLDFAYSTSGNTFLVGIDDVTNNLRFRMNTNSNAPLSWSEWEDLELGSEKETANPTIAASRLPMASAEVIVFASSRTAGSDDNFIGRSYAKSGNAPFSDGVDFDSEDPNLSILHPESYIRYEDDATTVRLSYVLQTDDASSNNSNSVVTYTGTGLEPTTPVSDPTVNVFGGFASAVAELASTNEPIVVYAGSSTDGLSGQNLYFAKQQIGLNTSNFDFPDILIYPNPTTDILHIQTGGMMESMRVFDLTGREMNLSGSKSFIAPQSGPASGGIHASLDVSDLPSNIYLIQFTANGLSKTYKFIKR